MHEAEKLFMLDGFCNFSDNISSIWQLTSSALSCMVRFSSSSSAPISSLCILLLFVAVLVWVVLFLVPIPTKFVVILRGWLFVFPFLRSIRFWLLWGGQSVVSSIQHFLALQNQCNAIYKTNVHINPISILERKKNLKCVDLYVYAFDFRRKKIITSLRNTSNDCWSQIWQATYCFCTKRLIRIPFKVKNELKLKQINLCYVVSSCIHLIHIHLHFRTSK